MTLDDLRIASPCSADWTAMPGDDRVRTCGDCSKRVYNLAAMTRAEAEALIASRESPCVRLYRRRDGTVVTADCAPPLRRLRRRIVAGALAMLAGCVVDPQESDDEVATVDDATTVLDLFPANDDAAEVHLLGMVSGLSFEVSDQMGRQEAPVETESTEQ